MQETMKGSGLGKRPRRTKAAWVEEVRSWRESGQSAEQYAQEHGLHAGTLAVWGSKVRDAVGLKPRGPRRRAVRFLPVRVADPPVEARGELEVVLLNGRRIRVSGDFQSEAVARLVEIAERGGRC